MEDLLEDEQQQSEGLSFDLKHYLSKLAANFKWILLALSVSLLCAFLYLRYSTPQYQISGYLLVGGTVLESGANNILTNAGMVNAMDNTSAAVNNEIFILKSHKVNGIVVDSLKLNIIINKTGNLKDQQILYSSLPVNITVRRQDPNRISPIYTLTLSDALFTLEDNGRQYKSAYGRPFILDSDTLEITRKPGTQIKNLEYSLQLASRLNTIKKYISRLSVEEPKNGGIGLLKLSVTDELPERANQYIEVLINSYNISYLAFKNQAIKRALMFLGERLETVNAELREQENQVRDFKANNQLYDISSTATELLGNLQNLDSQKSQNDYQEQLLDLVETGIKKYAGKEEIIASANGLMDPVLGAQVTSYNELVMKKQMIQNTGTAADPRLAPVTDQLADLRQNVLKNITNIRRQFTAGQNYVSSQKTRFSSRFQSLPEKEKQYVELNRRLVIKESQYTFLLQKKEETEIQLVSSDGEISRTADDVLNEGMVAPVRLNVYGIAVAIGLLIPCSFILMRVLLNQKIETRREIEKYVTVPILGELSRSTSNEPIVISPNNRSAIAEQLRAIRTNLTFMGAGESHKVFVVTSAMSGEGKSFVSLNLGSSLAIANKKVAVLELDMRKPMLSKKLGVHNNSGISNYLIDETVSPQQIIQSVKDQPNLYLLNSGPIPPNPGELIIHPRMNELLSYLRHNFDYVILDSPPVGLVADAISLAKLSDLSIFIIQPNFSLRSSLHLLNDLHKANKFPKLSLIVNSIEATRGYGGYGYGYGYAYGYGGYYAEEDSVDPGFKKSFKNIFKRS